MAGYRTGSDGGVLLATGWVIMLQAFPKSRQGIATAIFGVGVMAGPSLGPVLGSWLPDNYSWPYPDPGYSSST